MKAKVLRIVTIVVMSLAAVITLLGGVGTTCVAFAAETFGPSMAKLVPVKPVFQALVVVSIAAAVVGVIGIVRLARRSPQAIWWLLGFLVVGLVASGVQFYYSLTLRGSTAPNNYRLYLTAFALVWLLVLGLPAVWRWSGFDRTRPSRGGDGMAAGTAMVAAGLLTVSTPLWAAPTHVIDGVNTVNVLLVPLLVSGTALVVAGALLAWGSRVRMRRRLVRPVALQA